MEHRHINDNYQRIAESLIDTEPDLEDFKIIIDKYGTDWNKAARKEK